MRSLSEDEKHRVISTARVALIVAIGGQFLNAIVVHYPVLNFVGLAMALLVSTPLAVWNYRRAKRWRGI